MNDSQDAVSSTFAFIIAVGIMLGSVAAIYQATGDVASRGIVQETEQVNLQSEAAALKQIILDSPGVVTNGASWDGETADSADTIERLGLLSPDGSGLQIDKLRNLRLAPFAANATDGYANYAEVKTAMGLDNKGLDFHIRAKPNLKPLEELTSDPTGRDKNLKVTYLAHWEGTTSGGGDIDDGLSINNFACEASPASPNSWRFSVDVTNGGSSATQFQLVWGIDGGETITRQDMSHLIAGSGGTQTVHVDVENVEDFTCDASTTAEVDVVDPVQLLRTQEFTSPTVSGASPSEADGEFYVEVGEMHYLNTDTVQLSYSGDIDKKDDLDLSIRQGTDPSGTEVYSDTSLEVANGNGNRHIELDATSDLGGAGEYTAYLTHEDSGIVATQRLLVVSSEPDGFTATSGSTSYSEDSSVAIETQFLSDLVEQFCPTLHNDKADSPTGEDWTTRCSHFKDDSLLWGGNAQPGDVFPDIKKDHMDQLQYRLLNADGTPRYDIVNTLVVGSNIAHNAMTPDDIKEPIEDWVLGGGTLIVFGSPDESNMWMRGTIFKAGKESSSGGISAPDVSHPLISTPESLAYDQYDTSGSGWKVVGGAGDYFTDVVTQGGTPITMVSDPGDFEEGTVIITSWLPYDIFGDGSDTGSPPEGLKLMYNFLSQPYRDLFVDYGPPIPDGSPAIPAAGRSFVDHPDLGITTLDFTLYVFPAT